MTLIVFAWRRDPVPASRIVALALIVAGVCTSAGLVGSGVDALGIVVLLVAGLVWAGYTIGLQRVGLDLLGVVLVICLASSILAAALALTNAMPSHLLDSSANLSDVAIYIVLQGVGTGILSTVCYVTAVQKLGGSVTAAAGALSPVLTALVAIPLLQEPISVALAVALGLIAVGVLAFNLSGARRSAPKPDARMKSTNTVENRQMDAVGYAAQPTARHGN